MAEDSEDQEGFFRQAGAVVSAVYRAVMRDGTSRPSCSGGQRTGPAFGKTTPDSIQVDEPGQVFNPLYSDIAADKRADAEGPWQTGCRRRASWQARCTARRRPGAISLSPLPARSPRSRQRTGRTRIRARTRQGQGRGM